MIKEFLRELFKIHSPSKEWMNIPYEYVEKDTKCDLCKHECKEDCYLIEITTCNDTRRHFINGIGFVCPLKKGERE